MQLSENSLDPTFPFAVIRNLGPVTVKGAEIAVDARPNRWLDLSLQVSYARARFNPGTRIARWQALLPRISVT